MPPESECFGCANKRVRCSCMSYGLQATALSICSHVNNHSFARSEELVKSITTFLQTVWTGHRLAPRSGGGSAAPAWAFVSGPRPAVAACTNWDNARVDFISRNAVFARAGQCCFAGELRLSVSASSRHGTILLLPSHYHPSWRKVGGALAGAAGLIFLAAVLRHEYGEGSRDIHSIYFYFFSAFALVCAARVITHRQPVYSQRPTLC